jgi:N-acetylglutamate synthase-like GNAT family acetyltransferase
MTNLPAKVVQPAIAARHDWPEKPIVPVLRTDVTIRPGVRGDIPFIDQLQKLFNGCLGFMYDTILEKHIEKGRVSVAVSSTGTPMGYLLAQHSYMSNDDCGIVYQLAVVPVKHRKLIGATLLKHFFEASPYQMKLCCCWCAQDLHANHFWAAMGFVPIAFRTGSRGKMRTHIFWQRRIRTGDVSTPFWFPAKTTGGAVAEDRIVVPIPPGVHWQDAMPTLLPRCEGESEQQLLENGLPDAAAEKARKHGLLPPAGAARIPTPTERLRRLREQSKHIKRPPRGCLKVMTSAGQKVVRTDDTPPDEVVQKPKRPAKPRAKADERHTAAAKELRARFLEQFNQLGVVEAGKYDPSRALDLAPSVLGAFGPTISDSTSRSSPGLPLPIDGSVEPTADES